MGEWVYRHRVGLLVTVVIYLVLGIVFLSYKIALTGTATSTMYIDLVDPDIPQPEDPEEDPEREIERMQEQYFERISNRVSDANSQLNASLRDDKGTRPQEIYDEARRVQEQLAASQQAYRQGVDEAAAMTRQRPETSSATNREQSSPRSNVKIQGNVAVEYDLEGRTDVFLHIPAYQCKEAGVVVVSITVNRNGQVTSASVVKSSSSSDGCLNERALEAAKISTFNASVTAPERQRGTITYKFSAQ